MLTATAVRDQHEHVMEGRIVVGGGGRWRRWSLPVPGHGLSHAPGFECEAAARAAAPSGQVADEVGGVGV